jgi:hypothetical protein
MAVVNLDNTERSEDNIIAETGLKSRGGLKDYNEMGKNVQRVLGDYLAATFKAKVTFAIDSVTFNTACVKLFSETQYVVVSVDEENQRVFIEPCDQYNRDFLKFALLKDGCNKPRKCITREFSSMLYTMMGWNTQTKYRCMAIYQEFSGKKIIVFNLDECLQVLTTVTKTEDGKRKYDTDIRKPKAWEGKFGYTIEELETRNSVERTNTVVTINHQTGERHQGAILPKLPTPEELIHSPYGGLRVDKPQIKEGSADEND